MLLQTPVAPAFAAQGLLAQPSVSAERQAADRIAVSCHKYALLKNMIIAN
jgi:hypothetical protein